MIRYILLLTLSLLLSAGLGLAKETGSAVFIARAKKLAEETGADFDGTMGLGWEQKIADAVGGTRVRRAWSPEEVESFLGFLEGEIGKERTLERIKTTSYIRKMRDDGGGYFVSFKKRFSFFDRYLRPWGGQGPPYGAGGRLAVSLTGFYGVPVEDMEANARFIIRLFKTEDRARVRQAVLDTLEAHGWGERQRVELAWEFFDTADPGQDGQRLLKFLTGVLRSSYESLGHEERGVIAMVRRHFEGVRVLRRIIERAPNVLATNGYTLLEEGGEGAGALDILKTFLREHLPQNQEAIVESVEEYFKEDRIGGRREVAALLEGALRGLQIEQAQETLKTIDSLLALRDARHIVGRAAQRVSDTRETQGGRTEYLAMELFEKLLVSERGIDGEDIQEILRKGPSGFLSISAEKLVRTVRNAAYMDELFSGLRGTRDTNEMIVKNPHYFPLINTTELDKVGAYLVEERGMSQTRFIAIIRGNASGAYNAKAANIRRVAEYMETLLARLRGTPIDDEIRAVVDTMIEQNIGSFSKLDIREIERLVEFFLVARGMDRMQVYSMLRSSPMGFITAKRNGLRHISAYTDGLFARGAEIGEESREKSNDMMEKNLHAYALIDTEEAEGVRTFITVDRQMSQNRFETVIRKNPAGLSFSRRKKLEHLTEYTDRLFSQRVDITPEARAMTNALMDKSLSDFFDIDTEETDMLAEFFIYERGMSRKNFISIVQDNPSSLSSIKTRKLRSTADHVDRFFARRRGGVVGALAKAATNTMMANNLSDFYSIDTDVFDEITEFMNSDRKMHWDRVEAIVQKSPFGLAAAKRYPFRRIAPILDDLFAEGASEREARDATNFIMEKNFHGFTTIDPEEFDTLEGYITTQRAMGRDRFRKMGKRNPGLFSIKKDALKPIMDAMDSFFAQSRGGNITDEIRNMTNTMMERDPSHFFSIDLKEFGRLAGLLIDERGMDRGVFEAMVRRNPSGLSLAKRDVIKRIAGSTDRLFAGRGGITDEVKDRTNALIARNLSKFFYLDEEELKLIGNEGLSPEGAETRILSLIHGKEGGCAAPVNAMLKFNL